MARRLQDIMRSATKPEPRSYCPDANDIIRINFDPSEGREQAERRPALVLSPKNYNERAELCILCPITNTNRNYPFDVPLPAGHQVTGVVRADHVKSFSWDRRNAEFICKAPNGIIAHVRAKIKTLAQIP
jgi:mRNA interferase MazF